MAHIIDRRLNDKGKSQVNRDRFLKRYKSYIKDAVQNSGIVGGITTAGDGAVVNVSSKDINTPTFRHKSGEGITDAIVTGNTTFEKGDKLFKPKGDRRGNQGGPAEDSFLFTLTKEEFQNFFFEGLALPHLDKFHDSLENPTYRHAGYTSIGTASNLHVVRSMRKALGRRIAFGGSSKALEEALENINSAKTEDEKEEAKKKFCALAERRSRVPFIDPIDLQYRDFIKTPRKEPKAVMFCIMDVSGSMGVDEKDVAKRFYLLLYLFLTHIYKTVEIVFICHTEEAWEASEEEFFYSRRSGGTYIFPALQLADKIVEERYPLDDWNIYAVQASDGDSFGSDPDECSQFLRSTFLPKMQQFAYLQINNVNLNALWLQYIGLLGTNKNFFMSYVKDRTQVYDVFRTMFHRGGLTP